MVRLMTAAAVSSSADLVLDAVVVGGGLAGLACGVALASGGLEVAVVDREDPAATLDAGFDGRTSAIAWGAQRVLDGIGVWAGAAAQAEPILEIRVADQDAPL